MGTVAGLWIIEGVYAIMKKKWDGLGWDENENEGNEACLWGKRLCI